MFNVAFNAFCCCAKKDNITVTQISAFAHHSFLESVEGRGGLAGKLGGFMVSVLDSGSSGPGFEPSYRATLLVMRWTGIQSK